jgi:hypothetical protein
LSVIWKNRLFRNLNYKTSLLIGGDLGAVSAADLFFVQSEPFGPFAKGLSWSRRGSNAKFLCFSSSRCSGIGNGHFSA